MAPSDSFMMDVENEILRAWGSAAFPKGIGRARDAVWAAHVRTCLKVWYGQGGDMPVSRREGGRDEMSWAEYKTWVEGGGGDEWFVGDDVEAE